MNISKLLKESLEALRRNRPAVLAYMAAVGLMSAMFRLAGVFMAGYAAEDAGPAWIYPITILMDLALAALFAALQAVVFSMIGREMDRPLWKCPAPEAALRRFFLTWFIINLAILAVMRMQLRAAVGEMPDLVILLEFVLIFAHCFAVPVGACVMFYGALEWREMGSILTPIARRFLLVCAVLFVVFGQYAVSRAAMLEAPPASLLIVPAHALLDAFLAVLDCFAFAAMWLICQIHRNEAPDTDDDFGW